MGSFIEQLTRVEADSTVHVRTVPKMFLTGCTTLYIVFIIQENTTYSIQTINFIRMGSTPNARLTHTQHPNL